jgi:hypothetical protein
VAAVVESREEEHDDLGAALSRKKRKPRSGRDKSKSRSVAQLEPDVKDVLLNRIVPSMIEYYGTQEDPWSLDGKDGSKFNNVVTLVMQQIGLDWDMSPNGRLRVIVRQITIETAPSYFDFRPGSASTIGKQHFKKMLVRPSITK